MDLLELGSHGVLLKGGHLKEDVLVDVFVTRQQPAPIQLKATRIATNNVHGTGCTLSSAIAAHLALGFSLQDAIRHAHFYLQKAIELGKDVQTGKGKGPVNHGYSPRNTVIREE